MSGQPLEVVDQSLAFEVIETSDVIQIEEAPSITEVDPLAAFVEKHGHKLIANHEGQLVTVAEAIANCPPFARLVVALGEGALSLFASQKPEQVDEGEVIETEIKELETKEPEVKAPFKVPIKAKEQNAIKPVKNNSNIQPNDKVDAELYTQNLKSQQIIQSESPKPHDPYINEAKVIKTGLVTNNLSAPKSAGLEVNHPVKADIKVETISLAKKAPIDFKSQEILQPKPKAAIEIVPSDVNQQVHTDIEKTIETKPEVKKVLITEPKQELRSVRKEIVPIVLMPEAIESKQEFIYDSPTLETKPKALDLEIKDAELPPKLLETYEINLKAEEFIYFDQADEVSEAILLENEPLKVTPEQSIYDNQPFIVDEILAKAETTSFNPILTPELDAVKETPITSSFAEDLQPDTEEVTSKKVVEDLADIIKTLEPETVTIVSDLLYKAVQIIQEIKQPGKLEGDMETHETDAIEIFTNIFKKLHLDYFPEDIKHFVIYLIKDYKRQINDSTNAKSINYALSDFGTHEGLTYLLSRTKSLKYFKGSTHNALGKLVLRAPKYHMKQVIPVSF